MDSIKQMTAKEKIEFLIREFASLCYLKDSEEFEMFISSSKNQVVVKVGNHAATLRRLTKEDVDGSHLVSKHQHNLN